MIWLLSSVLWANELPLRPEAPVPVPGECAESISLSPGVSIDCNALAIPISTAADLLATEKWADHLYSKSTLLLSEKDYELQLAEWRIEFLETELVVAQQPVPVLQRTETHLAIGVVGGVIVTVGAGWALSEVSR
jgi:hypothetical protein